MWGALIGFGSVGSSLTRRVACRSVVLEEPLLFWSFCYVVLARLLQLAALRFRSEEFKELEIVVLRHELAVFRRQTGRAELKPPDRVFSPPRAGCCRDRGGARL